MFTKAIVRPPAENYVHGITTSTLGAPDLERALHQHAAYCSALEACGLTVFTLDPDHEHPDSTFVEDTAVVTPAVGVLTRPGAPSRMGEVTGMAGPLARHYGPLREITAPGTVDGGDICEAGNHFFIGVSERTNEAGAAQLAEILQGAGHTTSVIDIRPIAGLLHLKTGIAWLGGRQFVAFEALARHPALAAYDVVVVDDDESYAANCVRVNEHLLFAAGFPKLRHRLVELGYSLVELEMSEFRKMDGGLSCLSLRF